MPWPRLTRSASRPAHRSERSWQSRLNWHVAVGIAGVWTGAFVGAAFVLFIVMGAARRERQLSVSGLLLAGIAINSVCGALILLVHGLTGMSQSFAISRWLIGGLDAIEFSTLAVYAVGCLSAERGGDSTGTSMESAGGRRSLGGDAWRVCVTLAPCGLPRRVGSRRRDGCADRPDRFRRVWLCRICCGLESAETIGS